MKLIISILFFGFLANAQVTLKPNKKIKTEVSEPSDICINPINKKNFFVVSDNGYLHETDADGKILRTADFRGFDNEAVYAKDNLVYVIQEFSRKINVFNNETFDQVQVLSIPYGGGRNKAYEAFTFNPIKNKFIILTEKDPIYLFELDEKLNVVNEIKLKFKVKDVSAITFHNNFIWMLSDEDRTIFKLNPNNYELINKWVVPIINPEGIAFDEEGNLIIVSDDRKMIYYFDNPEN
jgi:uncharacterized protein YjiK